MKFTYCIASLEYDKLQQHVDPEYKNRICRDVRQTHKDVESNKSNWIIRSMSELVSSEKVLVPCISSRGVEAIKPGRDDLDEFMQGLMDAYHPESNPEGVLVLLVSENKLMWNTLQKKLGITASDKRIRGSFTLATGNTLATALTTTASLGSISISVS